MLLTNIDLKPSEVLTDQFSFGLICIFFVIKINKGEGTLNGNNVSWSWLEKIYAEMEEWRWAIGSHDGWPNDGVGGVTRLPSRSPRARLQIEMVS